MKRKRKVEIIAATIMQEHFGQPIADKEARWLAEHIVDALKQAKAGEGER